MAIRCCPGAAVAADLDPPSVGRQLHCDRSGFCRRGSRHYSSDVVPGAAAAVAAGELTVVLAQREPPPFPVHMVLPSARTTAAKQRAILNFAAPPLRRALLDAAAQIEANRPDMR